MHKATTVFRNPPGIVTSAAVGGKMENEGPYGDYFDKINDDPYFTRETYEEGESQLQKQAVRIALEKAGAREEDIDVLIGGDLLNQCVGTTYGLRDYGLPFLGIYSACSTMSEGLLLASMLAAGGFAGLAMAVTSSHYCTAERQYRMPLNYGGQRPPTAQRTATAGGAAALSPTGGPPYVRGVTIGRIVDMGVTDANNMGAAMAPAAYSTIREFFADTGMSPSDFDHIVTGDLGKVGSRLLYQLGDNEGIDIRSRHLDCGLMIYDSDRQDVHSGGSGCGCAAGMLCGYFIPELKKGRLKNILFAATGALLSPTVNQQGESIPSVSHLVWISNEKE